MRSKKIFVLLPDGIGLRNFAFTTFVEIGERLGWEVVFWNLTGFDLKELDLKEIPQVPKPKPYTDLVKRAKIRAELGYFETKFEEPVYGSYYFAPSTKGIKNKGKNALVQILTGFFSGEKGLKFLRKELKRSERGSTFYRECYQLLQKEQPEFIFCTNQRPVNAIAPLTAAQDLGIPTASFVFSWDNLPKATMVVEPDYFFVWSEHMKIELQKYYPSIGDEQIKITGTPQFQPHFNNALIIEKEVFFDHFGLDLDRRYLCFSGDDITTSPHDEYYLEDVAFAVRKLNAEGVNLGIIFRGCPTEKFDRYKVIIEEFRDVIVSIEPLWESKGESWNQILPTKEDLQLQINIIHHTFMVINVASSMVFDYVAFGKPCAFINYNPKNIDLKKDVRSIYNYIHFRSMPAKSAVLWIDKKEDIIPQIEKVLQTGVPEVVKTAGDWFKIINCHPPELASERIWENIDSIYSCT